jgi:hypothetical protein
MFAPKEEAPDTTILALQEFLKDNFKAFKAIDAGKFKKIYRLQESPWVIKFINDAASEALSLNEHLYYKLSRHFCLFVVPYTRLIQPNSDEGQIISAHQYYGFKPISLQRFIAREAYEQLDINHAHQTILLNWILGRTDAKEANSIIDSKGKVWDVDNDMLFKNLKKICDEHFILAIIGDSPFDPRLLAHILTINESITVIEDVSSINPEQSRKKSKMTANLLQIKEAIRSHQGASNTITPNLLIREFLKS